MCDFWPFLCNFWYFCGFGCDTDYPACMYCSRELFPILVTYVYVCSNALQIALSTIQLYVGLDFIINRKYSQNTKIVPVTKALRAHTLRAMHLYYRATWMYDINDLYLHVQDEVCHVYEQKAHA